MAVRQALLDLLQWTCRWPYRRLSICLRGACLPGLVVVCACSREPAGSPEPSHSAAPSARAGVDGSPSSDASQAASPRHLVRVAPVTMGAEELVGIEPGELGTRKRPSSALAFVTARGEHAGTFVVLDAQAPRPLPSARTPLVMLVDEDAELSPGAHELTAYREREGGLVATHFGFSVGSDGKVQGVEPIPARCVLGPPRGTYRGADASLVRVIPIASAGARSLRLSLGPAFPASDRSPEPASAARAKGPRVQVETLDGPVGSSFALGLLPSGDYALRLECLHGGAVARESKRIITVEAASEPRE